jgi:HK97 family phage prohead protease
MNKKQFELKSVGLLDAGAGTFRGRASVYGNADSYGDIVMPGAFAKSLARSGGRVVVLSQHDTKIPIGHGVLTDRADGLWIDVSLVLSISQARDDYERVKAGLITGLSIGYEVAPGGERFQGANRLLTQIDLWEVSLVTFPANVEARILPTTIKGTGRRFFDAIWKDLESRDDDEYGLKGLAARMRALRRLL